MSISERGKTKYWWNVHKQILDFEMGDVGSVTSTEGVAVPLLKTPPTPTLGWPDHTT